MPSHSSPLTGRCHLHFTSATKDDTMNTADSIHHFSLCTLCVPLFLFLPHKGAWEQGCNTPAITTTTPVNNNTRPRTAPNVLTSTCCMPAVRRRCRKNSYCDRQNYLTKEVNCPFYRRDSPSGALDPTRRYHNAKVTVFSTYTRYT